MGKCVYCGFTGTNDMMEKHAGEMCFEYDNGIIFDMVQQEYTLTDVTPNLTSNPTTKLKMYWGNR